MNKSKEESTFISSEDDDEKLKTKLSDRFGVGDISDFKLELHPRYVEADRYVGLTNKANFEVNDAG
jgi:hypothetical protein